jgi:adenylate cyclase
MEPLFSAVICGCNADLFREALHEVYIPRIQRGNAYFAANVLGARGPLVSVLVHFFENGRWGSPVETTVEEQKLTADDQLLILIQAGQYLTTTRGYAAPEVRVCYECAESLCRSLHRPVLLYVALMGQWRHSLLTDKLNATMHIAQRVYSLAQEQNEPALKIGPCAALAATHYFLGNFETCGQYAIRGVQIWRSGGVQSSVEECDVPEVACLIFEALFKWHIGEIARSQVTIEEALSLAKELHDMHGLAVAVHYALILAYFERNPIEVERRVSELIELSTRQNFAHWLAVGTNLRALMRSVFGDTREVLPWIEDHRAIRYMHFKPFSLALKAEALYLANRISEALEAIKEAERQAEISEERHWCAELQRLRGVFLAAIGSDETQIEASFCAAIRIAKEQKSVSLEKRAEGTYAEYRRQKASAPGGRGFRLPL